MQPPGSYMVETLEERIPTLLATSYRRVSTCIYLHEVPGDASVTGIVNIDPEELEGALALDAMPPSEPPLKD